MAHGKIYSDCRSKKNSNLNSVFIKALGRRLVSAAALTCKDSY